MSTPFVNGMKVRYLPQPEWGVGHLLRRFDDGNKAEVLFPSRDEPVIVSIKGDLLVPHQLAVGDPIRDAQGRKGQVTGEQPGGRGLRRYEVRFDDGEDDELPESALFALPSRPDLLSHLRSGETGDARSFLLRKKALLLDEERRCDALGALLASRVMVKPHQVGVVQRVLGARAPRFVLADEVGLGKTIEAGMIFSALRLSGLANRVLVVAPGHLTVQWLAELFHKFNQLFTLMDADRYAASLKEQPGVSPWRRFDKVVTSLETLARGQEHRAQVSDPEAFWDLVIIDEAHHLKGERAFEAASALAANTWGLLLLTATPMQLDPDEYRGLLTLLDPQVAPTTAQLRARLEQQEMLSEAVRALLGKGERGALDQLASRFPEDETLGGLLGKLRKSAGAKAAEPRAALLEHLAETYSLSERLVRNRRAVVGGFSERRLHRHRVVLGDEEAKTRNDALALLREGGTLRGAALSASIRRLESSTAAFNEAARASKLELPMLPERGAKREAFLRVLGEIWKGEPSAKVLVFTESRATLEMLRSALTTAGVEPLGYHGELSLLERDRQVARFRDPDGPKVLLCTEVGGEGRNFQFAHHLVCYDLPWSPSAVEQRIGRLDRIGQSKPVEIHVFEPEGTLSAEVVSLFADAVGVFGETVGGLDAVLEEVEPKITELALQSKDERAAYAQALKAKVEAARDATRRAYDPLLDLRSQDLPAVEALVARGRERLGLEAEDEEDSLEEGLWALARDLDERLEEAVTELARRVGIGVDTDEQVEAFECAFQFGHALNVEALPGLSILEDRTELGTFWRDTAVEKEEIDYFATGHRIVEALFGFLKDGPFGRTGARGVSVRGLRDTRGIEVLFGVIPPEPEDTSPGAQVPSRQLARFLERWMIPVVVTAGADGKPQVDEALAGKLASEDEETSRPLKGDVLRRAFPQLATFVDPAVALATATAERRLQGIRARAREAIVTERDRALRRLELSLAHQGLEAQAIAAQLDAERAHAARLLEALDGVKVALDSACLFVSA